MSAYDFLEIIGLSIGALLPIMNPFSTIPMFLTLSAKFDPAERRRQAIKGGVYAFGILVTFLLLGNVIIDFFGISVSGIRTAGGLIIAYIGFRMLFPANLETKSNTEPSGAGADISFTPIAMPSLAGPGSISVVLTASAERVGFEERVQIVAAEMFAIAVCCLIAVIVLIGSSYLLRVLGKSGLEAMTRIFGFLLICIGMQFVMTGIDDFFQITGN